MNYTFRTEHFLKVLALTVVVSLPSSIALAQPPGGGGGRGGGGGGFGGGRGQGRMFGQRQMNVMSVPIEALQAGLKLTGDQKTKITKIQEESRPRFGGGGGGGGGRGPGGGGGGRGPGGPPGGPPGGGGGRGPGGPPGGGGGFDFQAMQARMDAGAKKIEALLTPAQKKALPALVKDVGALRTVGIPAQLYGDLQLTGDQKTKIGTLAKQTQDTMQKQFQSAGAGGGGGDFRAMMTTMQKMREDTNKKALAYLNAGQKAKVDKYMKANPQRGFGGGGGRGGGGGGFGGGRGGGNAQANRQHPGG